MLNCTSISNTCYADTGHPDHAIAEPRVMRVHISNEQLDLVHVAEMIHEDGLIPVPLRRWSDQPAVGLERWVAELSVERIRAHWRRFPHHGLGVITEVCD